MKQTLKLLMMSAVVLLMGAGLTSCDDIFGEWDKPTSTIVTPSESGESEPTEIAVTGITLDKTEASIYIGETTTLTATVTPDDATDKTVTWTSSDETKATVANGIVTAVAAGTATITAKAGSQTATCTVTVNDDYSTPLTFEAADAAVTVTIKNPLSKTIKYSLDGADKVEKATNPIEITIPAGKTLQLYGNNDAYAISYKSDKFTKINFDNPCYVYGNIMSLIDETNFATKTELTAKNTFISLFKDNENSLLNHETKNIVLPATTLTDSCYYQMFYYCRKLTRTPVIKVQLTGSEVRCMYNMFLTCTQLKTVSEGSKIEGKLGESACYQMFYNCENLTSVPSDFLSVTAVSKSSCSKMFYNCKPLTTAPKLPATDLAKGCYDSMFYGCTSLAVAWVKADFSNSNSEMKNMFNGCASAGTLYTGAASDTNWKSAKTSHLPNDWIINTNYTDW